MKDSRFSFLSLATGLLASGLGLQAPLAPQEPADIAAHYVKSEHMVPMRDGVSLYTQVYSPADGSRPYAILMTRTPYGVGNYGPDRLRPSLGPSSAFAEERYVYVYQDVRGKFHSEGKFVHHPVYHSDKSDPSLTDESSDTYDTIEWLLANIPNHSGRVGQWGISYAGWETAMGMIDAHPALAASSPQGAPADQFVGDDYHHNGAFRLMYAFGWTSRNARVRVGPAEERTEPFSFGTPDGYRFFLELGPVSNVDELYFHGEVPTWNEFVEHGTYDEYWQSKNVLEDLVDVTHPVLNVVGWFDAEDLYGPLGIYYAIERSTPDNRSTLIAGPWRHGGWARSDGDSLGDVRFDSPTGPFFREVERTFFAHHLGGEDSAELPEALVFETGANEWRSYDRWPPAAAVSREIYFHAGGGLSFAPPDEAGEAGDAFVSDPDKPVPYTAEIRTSQGHLWMVEDQRFASTRPDVLVYATDVLTETVTIAGPILAHLYVSTSGTDADWIVKLIDVYPEDTPDPEPNPRGVRMGGYQMLLAGDVIRSKFRNSLSQPEPIVRDQVTEIVFDLLDKHHTFLKGHRIMVQVQSTWFPLIDRNPQTFVDIYRAVESDFQKATHRLHRSSEHPSHLEVQVIE